MILVIGDLILDQITLSRSYKNSPEAPVPILEPIKKKYFLGGAANVANNIKKFGEDVMLVGVVDSNLFKSTIILKKILKNNSIKNKLFESKKFTPPLKERIYCNNKMIYRVDYEKKNLNDKSKEIFSYVKKNIHKFSILILSDYNKGTFNKKNYKKLTNLFRENNKITICNPKKNNISYYNGCDIIVPNEKEFNSFFPKRLTLRKKIKNFFIKNHQISHLIITRGDKHVIYSDKRTISLLKVKKINPIDVTGASDTFISILGIFLKNKYSLKIAISKAILASRIVIKKKFTSFIKKEEL